MKAIALYPIPLRKIMGNRVRRGSGRQSAEEGGIEDRDVGHVELGPGRFDAGHGARIVQRSKRNQVLDLLYHLVIDDRWISEVRATVNHPVANRTYPDRIKINAGSSKIFCHGTHRRT